MKLNINTIESDLENLMRRLFESELRDREITLAVESVDDKQRSSRSIAIIPTRLGCAPIIVFCENGGAIIYLTIGRDTSLEVPLDGKRYTNLAGIEELIALIQAVAAGRFEEDIWMKGSKIVRSSAKIFLDNALPITIKNSSLINLFSTLEKREYKYLPYHEAGSPYS